MEKNRVTIVNLYLQGKRLSEVLNILSFPRRGGSWYIDLLKGIGILVVPQTSREVDVQHLRPPPKREKLSEVGFSEIPNVRCKNGARTEYIKGIGPNNCEERFGPISLKKRKVHFISAKIKEKRLARSKALLARFTSFVLDEVLFSDEKFFMVEQAYNRQNDRILSSSPYSIPQEYQCVQRVQYPQSVIVWAGVSAKGCTTLVFIPPGVKVNAVKYQ